jgi:large subunit ribosomal protein L19
MAIKTVIKDTPVKVGDTIKVKHQFTVDDKTQTQTFQGIIIGIQGREIGKTFTVRKISADAIGVEKIWPVHSPNILKVTVVKPGNTRRAKLYYLRNRIGKTALKVK